VLPLKSGSVVGHVLTCAYCLLVHMCSLCERMRMSDGGPAHRKTLARRLTRSPTPTHGLLSPPRHYSARPGWSPRQGPPPSRCSARLPTARDLGDCDCRSRRRLCAGSYGGMGYAGCVQVLLETGDAMCIHEYCICGMCGRWSRRVSHMRRANVVSTCAESQVSSHKLACAIERFLFAFFVALFLVSSSFLDSGA
jgi:hypothetical protein